jgi:hypothetical protein
VESSWERNSQANPAAIVIDDYLIRDSIIDEEE